MKKYILIIIMFVMSKNIFAQEQISNLVVPVSYFINHVSQLGKLKDNLNKYRQSSVIGVSGMGKTQLIRMYAYENKADYDIIWFIDCNLDIRHQLLKLAKSINAGLKTPEISENINHVRKDLMSYLASKDRWLLVFDNLKIGENKKVQDFIEWEHNGNVIFGSQSSELLPYIIKVNSFSNKEAVLLIKNILENKNPEMAEFLAKEFGGYPILMVQGAQIVNQVQGLNLEEYKKKVQESGDKIELNIELATNALKPNAKKLLNAIALVNNQSFSKEVLNAITGNKNTLDDDIYELSKFALISNIDPDEMNPVFEMHDVIAGKIVQINSSNNNKGNLKELITNLLNTIPKSLVKGRIFRNTKTMSDNIEIITQNAENYNIKAKKIFEEVKGYETFKSNIIFGLAISNIHLGNLKEARENIQIMENMFNQNLIEKSDAATIDYAKAKLLSTEGKFDEALKQINNTINACIENGMKPQDSFLTGLYLVKVDILNNLKNYKDALTLLEKIYTMKKPQEKEEHQIFGRIFTQMSRAKLGLGNTKEALEYAKKAKMFFLNDPARAGNNIDMSPDVFLAKAFAVEEMY
ncbi:MAG: tetratricopeptide repeat protein [Rickettsia endosymbiont of Pentastiridius leporinus]